MSILLWLAYRSHKVTAVQVLRLNKLELSTQEMVVLEKMCSCLELRVQVPQVPMHEGQNIQTSSMTSARPLAGSQNLWQGWNFN